MSKSENGDGSDRTEEINSFRELREYAQHNLDVDHYDVHPIAGLIDDDRAREVLMMMAELYDPTEEDLEAGMPRSFWETPKARRAIRKYGTNVATKAIAEGNVTQANYLTGLPSYKNDVSGIHAINQLADWLVNSEQCKLIYLSALMGRGKTDFSLTMLEIVHDHFRRIRSAIDDKELLAQVPRPEFATNFYAEPPPGMDVDHREIHRYSELLEWSSGRSSDDELWFIFDEASTELTAQSGKNAQQVAEVFAPFVKKMRKRGVNLLVIGHDRGDVHVAIRSVASFIDKVSLKSAEIWQGIGARQPQGHVMSVGGIPETRWRYDTDDVASWEWDASLEDETGDAGPTPITEHPDYKEWRDGMMVAVYQNTDLTQDDVGGMFGVSGTTVGRKVAEAEADDLLEPAPAQPQQAVAD